jgi:hypothetical protein
MTGELIKVIGRTEAAYPCNPPRKDWQQLKLFESLYAAKDLKENLD